MNRSTLSGIEPIMKSLLLLGGLASSLVVGMVALPAAAVAEEVCHGRPATLVGSPDATLVGTDGDDVIVTKGSRVILADDGNDLVCVTGSSRPGVRRVRRRRRGHDDGGVRPFLPRPWG